MRVTNSMINKTSMRNMNSNKVSVDKLNTQMSTQKKISRPSEDPVIAIRALRLRSNLNEVNQFYEKNIPDAESWLDLTETALQNMKGIVTEVYKQCVNGSTDTLDAEDRDAILQNMQALRVQVYKEGNADNAGRTIFTGYKTNSKLTFEADEIDTTYNITENMSFANIEEKKYYSNQVTLPTEKTGVLEGVEVEELPQEITNFRMRLSYDEITGTTGNGANGTEPDIKLLDKKGNPLTYTDRAGTVHDIPVKTISYEDWSLGINPDNPIAIGTEEGKFTVPDDEVYFIPESGELIFGKNVAEGLQGNKTELTVSYSKTGFEEGEIRPEHYFNCENVTDPTKVIEYTKENQEISYTIAFDQALVVNTQASDVFDAAIGRDIDELTDAVKAATAANGKVAKIEEMMDQEQYADDESQAKLGEWLEAAKKEASYMDDNMQKMYSSAISKFQGYLNNISAEVTEVGSKGDRLALTKTRVSNQQTSFEKLKSNNEDRELSDIIVDYTSSYTAYQASLMASSKTNQQTLLNYL